MYLDAPNKPEEMILVRIFTQYPFHVDRLDCSIIGNSNGNMLLTEQELRSALAGGCKVWLVDEDGVETPITLEEFAAEQGDIYTPEEEEVEPPDEDDDDSSKSPESGDDDNLSDNSTDGNTSLLNNNDE